MLERLLAFLKIKPKKGTRRPWTTYKNAAEWMAATLHRKRTPKKRWPEWVRPLMKLNRRRKKALKRKRKG